MSRIDRRYIDSLTVQALRNELTWELEQKFALIEAFKELPDVAPVEALHYLSEFSTYPRDREKGKQMQREFRSEVIPPNAECESGAGLWSILRDALRSARAFDKAATP